MSKTQGDSALKKIFDAVDPFRLPPVSQWRPAKTVDFDLVIRADGRWVHEGGEIRRHKLVKLFSTVLSYREGDYFLVTPPVRYRIQVEDTPFQVVEVNVTRDNDQQVVWFRTNMDETFPLDLSHPIDPRIDQVSEQPSPVVTVRDGLTGRLARTAYYQLAEFAEENPAQDGSYGVYSSGQFHTMS